MKKRALRDISLIISLIGLILIFSRNFITGTLINTNLNLVSFEFFLGLVIMISGIIMFAIGKRLEKIMQV
jgi:hypothetical protein